MPSNFRILPASMANRWTFSLAEPHFQNRTVILPTQDRGDTVPAALGASQIRLSEVIVRKSLRAMFLVRALILSTSPSFTPNLKRTRRP